jgi:signal transduction histidine kinase
VLESLKGFQAIDAENRDSLQLGVSRIEELNMIRSTCTELATPQQNSPRGIQQQARLFAERTLARELLDAMPNIVLVLNRKGRAVYVNTSALKLLGLKDECSLLGLCYGEVLGCVHAFEMRGGCGTTKFCETCGAAHAILSSQCGCTAAEEWRITRQQDDDVDALVFQVWATPVEINSEQFTVFACVDISDAKRRRALERIFFHDILNTAGILLGTVELMLEMDSGAVIGELEQKASRLARRLVNEIKAQRDLAEAESYELSVALASIHSLEFLQQIGDMYEQRKIAEERHIRIAEDAEDVTFVSDPTLLGRVIGNMVKNALEASLPGQTVTLGSKVVEKEIELWVHNDAFIPREVRLQIFQRAFSTRGPGRGLGTYSMKLLSQRYLGGDISFTSSEEEGTIFKARYPLRLPGGERA